MLPTYEIDSLLKPTGEIGSVVVIDWYIHIFKLGFEEVFPCGDVEQRGNTHLLEQVLLRGVHRVTEEEARQYLNRTNLK